MSAAQKLDWSALEALADSPEFDERLRREFPRFAAAGEGRLSRRNFLKLMGASLALAGLNACSPPPREQVLPYVRKPEDVIPGKPLFFATAMPLGGYASGLLVESHEGRPTKVEGNPSHPESLGAASAIAQAAPLTLYDPERSQTVSAGGQIRTWEAFLDALLTAVEAVRVNGGAGLHVLTETVNSPTLADQLRRFTETFPSARWHQYEPLYRGNAEAGARLAFGEVVETRYQFANAAVIVSLDADFLACDPGTLRYGREFSRRRRAYEAPDNLTRLYVVESMLTGTGASADRRLPLASSRIESYARALAARVGVSVEPGADPQVPPQWLEAVAADLLNHHGECVIVVGDGQPPSVHAFAHAMNAALGNVGNTLVYTDPVAAQPVEQTASLRELTEAMQAGGVQALVILGGNPAYTAPADIPFAAQLPNVPFSVHLSLYEDETTALTRWHVPEAHSLEMWGDARAADGTASIIQPLIAPLYGGRTAVELMAVINGQGETPAYDLVRAFWQSQNLSADFEAAWREWLSSGVIPNTALPVKTVTLRGDPLSGAGRLAPDNAALEIVFRPDPHLYDGRFANNAWLQELPRPVTHLTWDNAALISPATAQRLGLANEDVVELRLAGNSVRAPVFVVPGHADDSVTVHLGYGRTRAGQVGNGVGFNAYLLRNAGEAWFATGLEIVKTGERHWLANTQSHHALEGRDIVRSGTLEQFRADPDFAHTEADGEHVSLYPEYAYEGYRWGMVIDLGACVGCQACVVACQSENNIPVVGKDEVLNGREMHWLRVDSYFSGDDANPQTTFQPVPCMHCEKAPCELVCPVAATVHSADGLNDMVYNRCVGTRYCSNNCPYKVRRFNFYQYADYDADPSLKLLANPDVTVRSRGVMEKCTYCVQRIRAAEIEARKDGRRIRDGDVVTACQATCPTEAIVFGDLNDPNSRVAQLHTLPLNYAMLAELNTQPRTTYLAAVRNPNPQMEGV